MRLINPLILPPRWAQAVNANYGFVTVKSGCQQTELAMDGTVCAVPDVRRNQ
jgi:hypothetical protein